MNKKTFEQELETIEWLRQHTPDLKAVEQYTDILFQEQQRYKQIYGQFYVPEVRR